MKNIIVTIAGLIGILSTSTALSIDVGIGAFLNRLAYPVDQTVDFYISGFNREGNAEIVDVHVGIIDGNGKIYEYPNWNTNLDPWLSSFTIPADFQLPVTLLGNFDNFPGGLKPGAYKFAVALTAPGSLNLLSFNTTPFKVLSLNSALTSGGISFAHGQSANNITQPIASAAAGFFRVESNDTAELQAISDQLTVDIEQCKFDKVADTLDANLDAGASLSLSSFLAENVILNKSDQSLSYGVFPTPPESFYQAGQLYTVSGTGGADIPAFSVSSTAPNEIIVTQPDLATLENIDSSQDFFLRWQGNSGVGEINLTLQGGRNDNSHSIICRVADDGELIIPSNLLVQLRDVVASTSSNLPNIPAGLIPKPRVNMVLSRNQAEFINNNDEDSTLLVIFWAMSLTTQIQ